MTNQNMDRPFIPEYDRSTNEQDRFLDYCQRNESLITIYLDSGLTLQGKVLEHDRKVLVLGPMRMAKEPRLIYKNYIALVRAQEVLPLFLEYKGRGNHITRKKAKQAKRRSDLAARSEAKRSPSHVREKPSMTAKAPSRKSEKRGTSHRLIEVAVKKASRRVPAVPTTKPSPLSKRDGDDGRPSEDC